MVRSMWFRLLLLAIASLARPAHALTSPLDVSQLSHSVWRVRDGILGGEPQAMTQTKDGYIWIGTKSGLYRFDGARFTEFLAPAGDEPMRSPRIISLLGSSDGSLWIGSAVDLERWKDGRLTHFPPALHSTLGYVVKILQTRDGRIWMARAKGSDMAGPLCEATGETLKCYDKQAHLDFSYLLGILEDDKGNLWLQSDDELVLWNPHSHEARRIKTGIANVSDGMRAMAFDNAGTLVVGTTLASRGLGLLRLENDTLERFVPKSLNGETLSVNELFVDSQKSMWIGTQTHGLFRVREGRVENYRAADGLSGDSINSIIEDREGNIWITTGQGVDRFSDIRVASFSAHEGLSGDTVNGVVASRDGSIWISNWHSIDILRDGAVTSLKAGAGFPGSEVTALYEDRFGRMWVGIDNGLTVLDKGKFKKIVGSGSDDVGMIVVMQEDIQGDLWAITRKGREGKVIRIRDDEVKEEISTAQFPVARREVIAADAESGVWMGTLNGDVGHLHDGKFDVVSLHMPANSGSTSLTGMVAAFDGTIYVSSSFGVYVIRGSKVRTLTIANGLPCDIVWSMVADDRSLWLYSQCGLISIAFTELDKWLADPVLKIRFKQIGTHDGVRPARSARAPATARSSDGKLWFANSTVLQMYDSVHEFTNLSIPPVAIERLVADGRSIGLSGAARQLPALTRDIQVDYTALSYVLPEKVQFRYRLDGYDLDWIDAQTRRQAFYTNLKPGRYTFRMTASNNDGVWNQSGASQSFEILPAYYQTIWFTVLCGLAFLLAIWLLYLARIRQLDESMRQRVDARAKEREQIARDLHDTLLQGMQGLIFTFQAHTERLKKEEPARAMLETAIERADDVLKESREQVTGVRKARASLASIVEELRLAAAELTRGPEPEVRLVVDHEEQTLTKTVHEELFRIGVEAVSNAMRHATSKHIEVVLNFGSSEFVLRVRDDGIGFDPKLKRSGANPGHFGLIGMEERARRIGAELAVSSGHGDGTELICRVPAKQAYESPVRQGLRAWLRNALPRHDVDDA